MGKALGDKNELENKNKTETKSDTKQDKKLDSKSDKKSNKSDSKTENKSDKSETPSTPIENLATKAKKKLINKLSLTGISSSSNNDEKSGKENGKKPVSAQNSQEITAESPPPIQLQKKKKLSFRQRLSRCGSGCKSKVTKKNSNEMDSDAGSTSSNSDGSTPSSPALKNNSKQENSKNQESSKNLENSKNQTAENKNPATENPKNQAKENAKNQAQENSKNTKTASNNENQSEVTKTPSKSNSKSSKKDASKNLENTTNSDKNNDKSSNSKKNDAENDGEITNAPNATNETGETTKETNSSNNSNKDKPSNNQDANHCRNFFCWCCSCCSCLNSNLTFDQNCKENSSLSINKPEHIPFEHHELSKISNPPIGLHYPSLEEVKAWGESFDKLIKCSWGRCVFREFLKREYSEENILFWLACEELKNECSTIDIEEKARFIYEEFISILSPKEVSLDSKVRDIINKNMLSPTKYTFRDAQAQIYTLMQRDSYPRFINSPMYRDMVQTPVHVHKGSVHKI